MSDAKPEVHNLQAKYREIAGKPYTFTWADRDWTIPHMRSLDYRIQAEIEAWDSAGLPEITALFDKIFGKGQAAAWAEVEVPSDFILLLFTEWIEHSGAQQGESQPSTSSSKSTGTKSRATSARSTRSGSQKPSTAKAAPGKAASRSASS